MEQRCPIFKFITIFKSIDISNMGRHIGTTPTQFLQQNQTVGADQCVCPLLA